MPKKKTCEEFIIDANKLHSNFYNYESVVYVNSTTNVEIICPKHGPFKQRPCDHLNKKGCSMCGREKTASSHRMTTKEFIQLANIKHDNLYDYSLTEYVSSKMKVDIICVEHGVFKQTPNNHLTGYGCNRCGCDRTNIKNTSSTEEFIERAVKIHGNLYSYENVKYVSSKTQVEIICQLHGSFFQKPIHHLNHRSGCPKCRFSKAVIDICNILENNKITFTPEYRFDDCRNSNPLPYDFFINEHQLCIEYDGEQHFKAVDFWGGHEGYIKQQQNDTIKTNYCLENNINLLRIRYDEDHISVLKEYFKNTFNIDLKD